MGAQREDDHPKSRPSYIRTLAASIPIPPLLTNPLSLDRA